MDNTVYHHADVTIDPALPTPHAKDIAEVFGTSAGQMDQSYGVKPIDRSQGVYRVGVTGAGAAQIKKGPQAGNAQINSDFYIR
ncbi:MAG: hypothetical protein ACK4NR_01190 [Micavibrio sp.]